METTILIVAVYSGHDAAVTILNNGELLLNLELERYSRVRHDSGFQRDFFEHCLKVVGISLADVDCLVQSTGVFPRPKSIPSPTVVPEGYVTYSGEIGRKTIKVAQVHHHLAHAACAFYTSPFRDAAILTYDGGGDGANISYSMGSDTKIKGFRSFLTRNIAGWFTALSVNNFRIPVLHANDPGSGAGKVMALAAFGRPDPDIRRRLLREVTLFGEMELDPRGPDHRLVSFNNFEDMSNTRVHRSQALACEIQRLAEDSVEGLFERYYELSRQRNLCYSGGVALNCIANTRALAASLFENLFIPPCPNDGGLALGLALFAQHHILDRPRNFKHFSAYTGPRYAPDRIDAAIDHAIAGGLKAIVKRAEASEAAKLIADRNYLCIWRGRSEAGPRALGHRSIVCRTDLGEARDFLNSQVKLREWYRPFAPIVLAEYANTLFAGPPTNSPYMSMSAIIRDEWRERLNAVCHVDGSTRPQILDRDHEPYLYDLVATCHHLTGIPAILNTSFNRKEPIVETPNDALQTFRDMPIQHLLLEDYLISKC